MTSVDAGGVYIPAAAHSHDRPEYRPTLYGGQRDQGKPLSVPYVYGASRKRLRPSVPPVSGNSR